jgi:hypothetical protein
VIRGCLLALRRRFLPGADDFRETFDCAMRESAELGLRLIPVVGFDICMPVAAALLRGQIEDAVRLVPPTAWVPAEPLYG